MILDHLVSAADRGVRIRLLIDDTFLLGMDKVLLQLHNHPLISYRVFNPYKRRSNGFASRMTLNLGDFGRLDHRMHIKAMIVDGRVAVVGGRDQADEYFGLDKEMNFRDVELLVGGPVVKEINAAFDMYWNNHSSVPIDQLSNVKSTPADLADARQVTEQNVHIHFEESAETRP